MLRAMERDTTPAVAARQRERLAALTGARRLEIAALLSAGVRALAEAGLRDRHPQASPAELRVRLAALLYGRDVAERVFGRVPDDAR